MFIITLITIHGTHGQQKQNMMFYLVLKIHSAFMLKSIKKHILKVIFNRYLSFIKNILLIRN